jgi:energy-converting hydrogenase Eha subunit B
MLRGFSWGVCSSLDKPGLQQRVEIIGPDGTRRVYRAVEQVAAAVVVIGLALVRIRQHLIGLLHRPETLGRLGVGIFVRVPEGGLLAKGFFDIGQRCCAVQPEGGVMVSHAKVLCPGPEAGNCTAC